MWTWCKKGNGNFETTFCPLSTVQWKSDFCCCTPVELVTRATRSRVVMGQEKIFVFQSTVVKLEKLLSTTVLTFAYLTKTSLSGQLSKT
ncbi:hypothetical protein T08_15137 [Trichinella sp. T8]|nr:hypothetical protein T08_15137 [Trichinella sp. T8]